MSVQLPDEHENGASSSHGIIIGGLGGSGTRAVAICVESLGYTCGPWLKRAHDSILFAALLKSPALVTRRDRDRQVERRLHLFERIMYQGLSWGDIARHPGLAPHWRKVGEAGQKDLPQSPGWFAKEPNSHLFVDDLMRHLPLVRYIHVTRHPLDMAFSRNKKQLHLWGPLFGLDTRQTSSLERAQLDYWIKVQERIAKAEQRYPGRCVILDYDSFTRAPEKEMTLLLSRLRLNFSPARIAEAVTHVSVPQTSGRWQNHGLGSFSTQQLDACRRLGWNIPDRA